MSKKKSFIKSTDKERIEFLRTAIRQATERDGVPCMCILCEALQFDYMAMKGEINLKTGKRNEA
jgi:hypothetical protein